jgi:hypothetical protein
MIPLADGSQISGLDADSVASMTRDEMQEYLALVIRYFAPNELPSLAWLRRAAAATQKSGSHSNSWRGDGAVTPGSQSLDAANPASKRENAVGLLQALLRRVPVDFQGSRSAGQNLRRPRKTTAAPSRRRGSR